MIDAGKLTPSPREVPRMKPILPLPALAAAALIWTAASAVAEDHRTLTGEVTYLDRMALPPEATLIVEVTGPGGDLLSEAHLPTEGRQVPIPFSLGLPEGETGTFRAGLALAGRVVWLGDPVALPAGTVDLGQIVLPRIGPVALPIAFRCGAHMIRLGFAGEDAVMDTGLGRAVLRPAPAASGARYETAESGTWLWTQGDAALVSIAGTALPECRAALPPPETPYDAGGNEPFWSLRIDAGRLLLSRLGMEDLTLPVTEVTLTGEGDILVTAADPGQALRAVVRRRSALCRDTMSGLPHPETVEVSMGDETLAGCGGDPWALLTGRTWVVEDIGGAGVIDGARTTLGFDASGRAYGSASCNRFSGAVEMTGEGPRFGPMATTMMACPDAVMAQERRMLDALAEVFTFDIDDSGALRLIGPPGPVITARAATDGTEP